MGEEREREGAIEINDIKWMFCGLRTLHRCGWEREGKWGGRVWQTKTHVNWLFNPHNSWRAKAIDRERERNLFHFFGNFSLTHDWMRNFFYSSLVTQIKIFLGDCDINLIWQWSVILRAYTWSKTNETFGILIALQCSPT